MPINTTQGNNRPSGAVAGNPPEAPTKSGKTKAPRKSSGAAKRPASAEPSPAASASQEIVFKEQPNPFHPPKPPFIWIDHPQEQERLTGPVYVVRLGVGGAQHVEMSIDGGAWQPCRLTSGYWWFDWSGIQPGKHTLVARMKSSDGQMMRTPPRSCDRRP
jgi:hypothetical protein